MSKLQTKYIDKQFLTKTIPVRSKDSYKNQFGKVLFIGGNENMGGAIQMVATGGVNTGAGLTTIATDPINVPAIHSVLPEAMVCDWDDADELLAQCQANEIIAIGPGMGQSANRWKQIKDAIRQLDDRKIIIIDADGIKHFANDLINDRTSYIQDHQLILTPHPGEWKTLSDGQISQDDQEGIQEWVDQHECILVLKSEKTKIYSPQSDFVFENTGGNPGMSTGGMGDTLVGMIAAACGQIESSLTASAFAVGLHSYVADTIYEHSYIVKPTELALEIPKVMKDLVKNK